MPRPASTIHRIASTTIMNIQDKSVNVRQNESSLASPAGVATRLATNHDWTCVRCCAEHVTDPSRPVCAVQSGGVLVDHLRFLFGRRRHRQACSLPAMGTGTGTKATSASVRAPNRGRKRCLSAMPLFSSLKLTPARILLSPLCVIFAVLLHSDVGAPIAGHPCYRQTAGPDDRPRDHTS